MFERYTEKARRVIFFARYEASMYGCPTIETEHLLLGLLRENYKSAKRLLPKLASREKIQEQIESGVKRGERISTSVEMPLSLESKQALTFAGEEATRIGHRLIGPEHLLLGLLRVEKGIASEILSKYQADLDSVRKEIGKLPAVYRDSIVTTPSLPADGEIQAYRQFVASLREGSWSELHDFFAREASFIDAGGKLWSGREQIVSQIESLLAPFATKNAKHHLEKEICRTAELWVGIVLWNSVHLSAHTFPEQVRMTLVFGNDAGEWSIFLLQITSVAQESMRKPAAT